MCTKQNIIFYDTHWNEVAEAASSKLKDLKAITYDSTHDIFYFTDRHENQTTINTLKLRNDGTTVINPLIQLTENEFVEDIVYDFNDDIIFYSDKENNRIGKITFDRSNSQRIVARRDIFLDTKGSPAGLELDACKRNLYYTVFTDVPNINMVSIKGSKSEPICNGKHYRPIAIALDEKNDRIYIADNQRSNIYSINSFTVEGEDFKVELSSRDKTPRSLAVDHEYIYYLDGKEHSLRRLVKHGDDKKTSEFMMNFRYDPTDVIVRSAFIDAIRVDLSKCEVTKERMVELQKAIDRVKREEIICEKSKIQKTCLHGGALDESTSKCICKFSRYDGDHCEIDLCYNFCMNGGECSMENDSITSRNVPTCSCTKGFTGERCETDVCSNYCMNGGKCSIDEKRQPLCDCVESFFGKRCESENEETQPVDVKTTTSSTTATTTEDDKILISSDDNLKISKCPVRMNLTYVILAVCLTLSLLFFLIILLVIKRLHKPMRPRIRKKYVVHKNIEPLTCRPTTEQCEVIIEDCCNMNICDTVMKFTSCAFKPNFLICF